MTTNGQLQWYCILSSTEVRCLAALLTCARYCATEFESDKIKLLRIAETPLGIPSPAIRNALAQAATTKQQPTMADSNRTQTPITRGSTPEASLENLRRYAKSLVVEE